MVFIVFYASHCMAYYQDAYYCNAEDSIKWLSYYPIALFPVSIDLGIPKTVVHILNWSSARFLAVYAVQKCRPFISNTSSLSLSLSFGDVEVVLSDVLFLKHESSILRQSSNPVCGLSMTEQVRLCAVCPWRTGLLFHEPHNRMGNDHGRTRIVARFQTLLTPRGCRRQHAVWEGEIRAGTIHD